MAGFALIIDHESCWGCKACEVACKQENRSPEGIKLIRVSENGPKFLDDKLQFVFEVNTCRHCDDPECAEVCPEDAITKREDGIVLLDEARCAGCGLCVDQCTYQAISLDEERGVAQKCNLCHHRVDHGLFPACADNICLAHCIYFGDPDLIKREIAEKRSKCVSLPPYQNSGRDQVSS